MSGEFGLLARCSAGTLTTAEVDILDGATVTTNEVNLNDAQPAAAAFTIGSEASSAITVNVQINDAAGVASAIVSAHIFYMASDTAGKDISGFSTTTFTAGTDGSVTELDTDATFLGVTEADGDLDVTITTASTGTKYMVCVLPNGKISVSGAITFA